MPRSSRIYLVFALSTLVLALAITPLAYDRIRALDLELVYRVPMGLSSETKHELVDVIRERAFACEALGDVRTRYLGDRELVVALPRRSWTLEQCRALFERDLRVTFEVVADAATPRIDLAEERRRFEAWRAEHPDEPVDAFASVPVESGGPSASLRWLPVRPGASAGGAVALPVEVLERTWPGPAPSFSEADLDRRAADRIIDRRGMPAIAFSMRPDRQGHFGAFSGSLQRRQLAITIDGEVVMAAELRTALHGFMSVEGSFDEAYVDAFLARLRSGPLPVELEFVAARRRGER
jgi:hypothetical protein